MRELYCKKGGIEMNEPLAKVYQQFFSAFEEQKVQEGLHLLPLEKVIESIK